MSDAGRRIQDAATLLARASGRLQLMATKRRASRAGVTEALAFAERARNAMVLVLETEQAHEPTQ